MERIDLLHSPSILSNEESTSIRNTHRSHYCPESADIYNDYMSVSIHVCGKEKQNVTYHMRYRRYLLMCMVILAILLLLYIPVYHQIPTRIGENCNSASLDVVASIPGWSYNTSRELSTYVKPNLTALHEPPTLCSYNRDNASDKPIFLIIVVCSAVKNFEARNTIRSTWGNMNEFNYPNYIKKLVASRLHSVNVTTATNDINIIETDNPISNKNWNSIYQYYKNIYHYNSDIVKSDLKDVINNNEEKSKNVASKPSCDNPNIAEDVIVKVLFLLGLPHVDNETDTELQHQVDMESEQYQDIIQENFIDSYNNLTLKSVMMLKWVSSHCSHSVQYLMKADDDMFVNVNKLVYKLKCINSEYSNDANLANHSNPNADYNINATSRNLLLGSLIKGARPIADSNNKWYSPQYMYSGKIYPPYLSGTGYVMSINTVNVLYRTALVTPIFHLEDIYITGICAHKAKIRPQHSPLFSYQKRPFEYCEYSNHITSHQLTPLELVKIHELFSNHTDIESTKCAKKPKKSNK